MRISSSDLQSRPTLIRGHFCLHDVRETLHCVCATVGKKLLRRNLAYPAVNVKLLRFKQVTCTWIQEISSGGVQVSLTKKKIRCFFCFFLDLSLYYRSQMVNFKEIYHFSRFRRGSNIFREGGVQLFPGGGPIAYSL